jgi:hypothetical protein
VVWKIVDSNLFTKKVLKVYEHSLVFSESLLLGGRRTFDLHLIDCVMMGDDHTLSFQVGSEVFSIRTRPYKTKHQETICALLEGVRRTDA